MHWHTKTYLNADDLHFTIVEAQGDGAVFNTSDITTIAVAQPTLDFANSNWIWTGENAGRGGPAPVGLRAFRKSFVAPQGKYPSCATVLLTADDSFTLYVNGKTIGTGNAWQRATGFTAALRPSGSNVFAISANNIGGPAGLVATVLIMFSDGTSTTYVTDASWKTLRSPPPAGFQQPGFNDAAWTLADTQGLNGVGPWGRTTIGPALDLTQSNWIWTSEVQNGVAPVSTRAFRKTILTPVNKCAICATVVIGVDDNYTLYANDVAAGSANDWRRAQVYSVPTLAASVNVFSLRAGNIGGPAGIIAVIQIAYDDGTSASFITDTTWKAFVGPVPAGFEQPSCDDSAWSSVIGQGRYGVAPWGAIPVPPV